MMRVFGTHDMIQNQKNTEKQLQCSSSKNQRICDPQYF